MSDTDTSMFLTSPLITRWAHLVPNQNETPPYPRPQLERKEWLSLHGKWNYTITSNTCGIPTEYEGVIRVPFALESTLSGVAKSLHPDEVLWYQRTIVVPKEWYDKKIVINFGAVDYETVLYCNGKIIGYHVGGFLPFSFVLGKGSDIAGASIVVAVQDPTDTGSQVRGKQAIDPSIIFYTAVSGIWQNVWLECVPEYYITKIMTTTLSDLSGVSLFIKATGPMKVEGSVIQNNLTILAFTNSCIQEQDGSYILKINLILDDPILWTPDNPFLYQLEVETDSGDKIFSYFAVRTFGMIKDAKGYKRFTLNNSPIFLNGVLDQGYFPDGLYTAPNDIALKSDIILTKNLGFNMIRKHGKVECSRFYMYCDTLGIIVFQDMPSGGKKMNVILNGYLGYLNLSFPDTGFFWHKLWGRSSHQNRKDFLIELDEMIYELEGFACIASWVIFNEAWGQFDSVSVSNKIKKRDPTRIIDAVSGWFDRGAGDVYSIHSYTKKLVPPVLRQKRAFVLSEYGGYTYSIPGHRWYPKKEFGYKTYHDKKSLQNDLIRLLNDEVYPLIAKGLAGAVYTQLSDIEQETNGLITYDREVVKIDIEELAKANERLSKYYS